MTNPEIDMAEVRRLSKLSVEKILENSPVVDITLDNYWSAVRGRKKATGGVFLFEQR
jgi:type IV secretory pathway ATPase VirB11/archaellum biosynthesis ATPase